MTKTLSVAFRMTAVTLTLTGLAYPLVVTAIARVLFPRQAEGSFVTVDGKAVGSELIGQRFADPAYFQGRPSSAGTDGYDAANSGGSNLGPTSKTLRDRMQQDVGRLQSANPDAPREVPIELVTTSASGLDPHISPEAALWQAPRVARARRVEVARVRQLVLEHVEGRQLGFLGEPRVNVLLPNLALDRELGGSHAGR